MKLISCRPSAVADTGLLLMSDHFSFSGDAAGLQGKILLPLVLSLHFEVVADSVSWRNSKQGELVQNTSEKEKMMSV
jgi:hypothetical protein